ncbi:hypothetical protein IAS59_006105 [Cryptococcus gattii]
MDSPIRHFGGSVPPKRDPFGSLQARTRRIRGKQYSANSTVNRSDLLRSAATRSWRSNNDPQLSVGTSVAVNDLDIGSGPSRENLINPFSNRMNENEEVDHFLTTSASSYNGDNDISAGHQNFAPTSLNGSLSLSEFIDSGMGSNEARDDADTTVLIRFSSTQTGNADASISLYPPDRSEYPDVNQWMEMVYTQSGRGSREDPIRMDDAINRYLQPHAESRDRVRGLVLQALWMNHTIGEQRFDLRETENDEE